MGNITAMSMTEKTMMGLPKTRSSGDFSGFTLKPENNWIQADKLTPLTLQVPENQRAQVKAQVPAEQAAEFAKSGKLTVYVTAADNKEIQNLKQSGWNVTFNFGGTVMPY